jgi:hypothetical protein
MYRKISVFALLAASIACGTSTPKSSNTGGSGNPPPANFPQMAGTWNGNMNFTVLTGQLSFVVTEDSSGNLTGTASSTPPGCEFNLPVTGAVTASGSFYLQTADTTTASFAGSLSNENKTASGNTNLGSDTGCGPRTGGTFLLQLE